MSTKEAQRLELLLEVGRLLSSKLELAELLTTVLELATRVVDAETASLLLLDPKTNELYFDVALGLGESAAKVRLKPGQGIAGSIAQQRKPEIINDVRLDKRWSPAMDAQSGFVTRSILGVPILLKGRLVGVVEAINKRGGPFDADDQAAFEAFASQAGVAIENARLFASLRDEKFKLATVFAQMRDGVVLTDAGGRVVLANDAAQRLLGPGKADLGAAFAGLTLSPALAALLADGGDFTATRESPTLLIVGGTATKAPLAHGEGRLFVFRDDTENRRQEGLKRTFLSLISHKLKTPLTAVIGFSDILLSDMSSEKTDAMTLKAARTINEQGNKVGELVDKLIRYTTLESPDAAVQRADFAVDEAVAEALKSLKDKILSKQAKVDYAPTGLTLNADRVMLVEVVKNLVENAVKFDPKPGCVVAVRVLADDDWAAVSVTDRGPGLPPEEHEAVFSRFHQVEKDFTGQQEGMGLGLPFVRKVAELHGGKAVLRSALGQGTTVTVTWPRRKPA
ncbi:MAG: GAF domain-containing protein [Elusimicrobia bacterium]|nr:GAF domain-containing protein [Elusimicrobiota bacterium]